MKLLLVALVAALVSTTAYANDNWVTDNGVVLTSGSGPTALNADGTYIYAVGSLLNAGVVRRRSLATAGWSTVDPFTGDGVAVATAIAIDQQYGLIYVVGYTGPSLATPASRWYVRRSKDHGANWETVHIGTYFANGQNYPSAVRVMNNHFIVVALTAYNASNNATWVIKTDMNNWGTALDVIAPVGNGVMAPHDMAFAANGDLLVTGSVADSAGQRWLTRRGAVSGFTTIDESVQRLGSGIVNVNGTYYETGSDVAETQWVTRRSTDDGATWHDVDVYQAAFHTLGASVRSLDGTIYVGGADGDVYAARKSKDGGTTWLPSDYYTNGVFDPHGQATDVFAAGGRIWSVGTIDSGAGFYMWTVRVLTP